MSATTEKLLSEIQDLEDLLLEARSISDTARVAFIESQLIDAKKRLVRANEALNEGRTVLKG